MLNLDVYIHGVKVGTIEEIGFCNYLVTSFFLPEPITKFTLDTAKTVFHEPHHTLLHGLYFVQVPNEIVTVPTGNDTPISDESLAMLRAGIESGRSKPSVYLGSFAPYLDDFFVEPGEMFVVQKCTSNTFSFKGLGQWILDEPVLAAAWIFYGGAFGFYVCDLLK